jgi:hypothetical protein
MFKDKVGVKGRLHIVLRDEFGNIKSETEVDNLVVNTGLDYIASRMKDATATAMSHMAVGSGSTAAAGGDTVLGTQIGSRVSLASTTVTSNSVVYVASFPAGVGTGAITEAGIFNAATSGTMLCRTVFGVVTKSAADSMQITWTITINAA